MVGELLDATCRFAFRNRYVKARASSQANQQVVIAGAAGER
jgi:hypothetical protein